MMDEEIDHKALFDGEVGELLKLLQMSGIDVFEDLADPELVATI
jgi:hypothetical protein